MRLCTKTTRAVSCVFMANAVAAKDRGVRAGESSFGEQLPLDPPAAPVLLQDGGGVDQIDPYRSKQWAAHEGTRLWDRSEWVEQWAI
eukprot:gene225-517_t